MWAVMGFLVAAAIGLVAVLAVGRRGSAQSDQHPWILYDTAKLHVGIMAGLAGFAFTGIVLVVGHCCLMDQIFPSSTTITSAP
jgi:hypothetical protein